jgi:hypothetical protein
LNDNKVWRLCYTEQARVGGGQSYLTVSCARKRTMNDALIHATKVLSQAGQAATSTSPNPSDIQSALTTIFDALVDSESSKDHRRRLCCELLACDVVVHLLWLAQRVERLSAVEDFKAIGDDVEVRMADDAIVILSLLATAGKACPRIEGEEPWQSELLEESLEGIIHLLVLPDNSLLWPVRIVAVDAGCTVMDVVETASDGEMHRMRHLIVGTWRGPNQFRESEVDVSLAPGAQLENFYTCTLAAVATAHTHAMQLERPPRILVIGLGGGTLVSFLQRHLHADVEAVEICPAVVRVASLCFGLHVEGVQDESHACIDSNGSSKLREGLPGSYAPLPNIETLSGEVRLKRQQRHSRVRGRRGGRKKVSSSTDAATEAIALPRTIVHVIDALEFVQTCERDSYDFVIVDTYTAEVFPPALMCNAFFDGVARVLTPGGGCAVNAGYGADEKRVLTLLNSSFGGASHVDVMVEQDAVKESDRDYENAVLYGNNSCPLACLPAVLPFVLDGIATRITDGGNNVHSLFWKQAPLSTVVGSLDEVCTAAKDAPVWDLFD